MTGWAERNHEERKFMMDTKRMRVYAPLLPEPGNKVVCECLKIVCECLDEIERLRAQRDAWKEVAEAKSMVTVLEDTREVKSLHGTEEGHIWSWEVGKSCDEITCYGENGQLAAVPWFAIHKNGIVIQRVNGAFVETVCY